MQYNMAAFVAEAFHSELFICISAYVIGRIESRDVFQKSLWKVVC